MPAGRSRRSISTRRRAAAAIAIATAVLLIAAPSAWAEGDLRIESDATYTVKVNRSVVHVELTIKLTNLKEPTSSGGVYRTVTYYYYDQFMLALPTAARHITAVQWGEPAEMTVETVQARDIDPYQLVDISLGKNLMYEQTQKIVLSFDLPGEEPRSEELTRVNPAYVGFTAWGWGDSGISSTTVRINRSFHDVAVGGPDMDLSYEGNIAVYTQDPIEDTDEWIVHFTARCDSALVTEELTAGDLEIHIRSWPGDDEWAAIAHEAVAEGAPVLQDLIGLEIDTRRRLEIVEALDPAYLGYAGWYNESQNRIEIEENIDSHVLLHEISHAWFNGDLFDARWINEGLAEEYSWQAATSGGLEVEYTPSDLTPIGEPPFALIEWEVPEDSPSDDEETQEYEDYGYSTSWYVIHSLVDEIGTEAMAEVFSAAQADESAYVGEGDPEMVGAEDDWRRLLDLVEEIGGSEQAEQLFRDFVVTEDEQELLDERAETRDAYTDLIELQDGLSSPWLIREPMSDWDFDEAAALIEEATEVVQTRNAIVALADELGLDEPDSLEQAYETARGGFDAAAELADRQFEAVEAVGEAADAVAADRSFFEWVGLIAADPNQELDEAGAAFAADDIELALAESAEVVQLIDSAEMAGRVRVAWAGGGLGFLLLAGTGAFFWVRHRRDEHQEAKTDDLTGTAETEPDPEPTA